MKARPIIVAFSPVLSMFLNKCKSCLGEITTTSIGFNESKMCMWHQNLPTVPSLTGPYISSGLELKPFGSGKLPLFDFIPKC